MSFSLGGSSVPKTCDGCGSELSALGSWLWVGAKQFHNRDCYDRTRPVLDVWRDRCAEVASLEQQLAFARDRMNAAERQHLEHERAMSEVIAAQMLENAR
jgi:hypothetical protein